MTLPTNNLNRRLSGRPSSAHSNSGSYFWLILPTSLSFVLAVFGKLYGWSFSNLILLGCLIGVLALWRFGLRFGYWLILLWLLGLTLGSWRATPNQADLALWKQFEGEKLVVEGVLSSDPSEIRSKTYLVELRQLNLGKRQLAGRINLFLTADASEWQRGDSVKVIGQLKPGYQAGSWQLASPKLISHQPGFDFLASWRRQWIERLRRRLPPENSSLVISFLLGERSYLTKDLKLILQQIGLIHLVVASGFHLMFFVEIGRRLGILWSRRLAAWLGLFLALGFGLIVGLTPSIVRALLVASLGSLTWFYARRMPPLNKFVLILALSLAVDPLFALNIGWQISFLAYFAISVAVHPIQRYLFGERNLSTWQTILLASLIVQIWVTPLVGYHFGLVSLISPLANLLIAPLVPAVMALGFGLIILPSGFNFLLNFLLIITKSVVALIIKLADLLSALPLAFVEMKFSSSVLFASYTAMALILTWANWQNHRSDQLVKQRQLKLNTKTSKIVSR